MSKASRTTRPKYPVLHVVVSWDWRAQPDIEELDVAVRELSNGVVGITQVDTESDQYAIVIAAPPMTQAEAKDAWEEGWGQ